MNKLYIKNFGPIKEADIDIKSFNLFIGEQSIGKSTIAKLITMFTDNYTLAVICSLKKKGWDFQLGMYDLKEYGKDNYIIEYKYSNKDCILSLSIDSQQVTVQVVKNGTIISDDNQIQSEIISMRKVFHGKKYLKQLKESRDLLEKDKSFSNLLELSLVMSSSLYVPAERIMYSMINKLRSAIGIMGETIPVMFSRFSISLEQAKVRFSNYDSSIFDITYLNEEKGSFFIEHSSKKKFSFNYASSGIQSTMPLILVLEDVAEREYSSIVIEEPESNLFPSTQIEVLKFILSKARVDGRIATVTTHSPYLLSALNNYLFAGLIEEKYGKDAVESLDSVLPKDLRLNSDDCSVYSIGSDINNGVYCKSLIDENTGMIDLNALDIISESLSDEFGLLESIYSKLLRNN